MIEHTFGIWKQRFRQLYHCKLRGIENICHFIRSCAVLHNMANEEDLQFLDSADECGDDNDIINRIIEIEETEIFSSSEGKRKRDQICNLLWNTRQK